MEQWPCRLEQGEATDREDERSFYGERQYSEALGTFSIEDGEPIIRYHPALRGDGHALTSTFAHELAHLLLAGLGDPPGGHELHEHATDCAATYLGFGLFLANSARCFEQFQDAGMQGWHARTSGYLSEAALVTATALCVRLFGQDDHPARAFLKPYLFKDYRKALAYIDAELPVVSAAMESADLDDWR